MGTRSIRRTKNHIKLIISIVILLTAAIACAVWFLLRENAVKKTAHISLDDATGIFAEINRNEYDSIFDNEILGNLQYLHEEYGIVVTLYVFEKLDDFSMGDMSLQYREEFEANADWLKIGFHSVSEELPTDNTFIEFMDSYERTEDAIRYFAGEETIAHVLRLHYWYATDDMMAYLGQQGIIGLLCSDKGKTSYNLSESQLEKLYQSRDGRLQEEDFTFYATDIRLEDVENIKEALETHKKDRIIVIFTHAWCFDESYGKLEEAVKWLVQEKYQFDSLESLSK